MHNGYKADETPFAVGEDSSKGCQVRMLVLVLVVLHLSAPATCCG